MVHDICEMEQSPNGAKEGCQIQILEPLPPVRHRMYIEEEGFLAYVPDRMLSRIIYATMFLPESGLFACVYELLNEHAKIVLLAMHQ
jgi:hypothetical protein